MVQRWIQGLAWPTFLRLDRPELQGSMLVVRGRPRAARARRRLDPGTPLGYLYERESAFEPESDLVLAAGHYDRARMVWSFSGEVTGITGITEPPAHPEGGGPPQAGTS